MLGPLEYMFGASLRLSVCLAAALAVVFVIVARSNRRPLAAAVRDWALATAVSSVVAFTQYAPYDGRGRPVDLRPLDTIWHALQGRGDTLIIANIALFVPVGAALALHRWRRSPALLASIGLSIGAEVMQYATGNGRVAQIDDVIVNAVGALLGWTLVAAVQRFAARSLSGNRRDGAPELQRSQELPLIK